MTQATINQERIEQKSNKGEVKNMNTIKVTLGADGTLLAESQGEKVSIFDTKLPRRFSTITGGNPLLFEGAKVMGAFFKAVTGAQQCSNQLADYKEKAQDFTYDGGESDLVFETLSQLIEEATATMQEVEDMLATLYEPDEEVSLTPTQLEYLRNSQLARDVLAVNMKTGIHKGIIIPGNDVKEIVDTLDNLRETLGSIEVIVYPVEDYDDEEDWEDDDYEDDWDDWEEDYDEEDYDGEPMDFDDEEESGGDCQGASCECEEDEEEAPETPGPDVKVEQFDNLDNFLRYILRL